MPKAYAFTAKQAAGVNPADWKRRAGPRRLRLVEAGHARGNIVLEVGE